MIKKIFFFFFALCIFTACSNENDAEKQAEFAKIVELRSVSDLLNDLYIGCDGDLEALARVLNATPSSIERLRKEETVPTDKFIERIREVAIYYTQNGQSFTKLQSVLDPEYSWYDSVLNFPNHHPFWFWGITIVLFLALTFITLIGGLIGLGAELILFLIAWICSLIFSPDTMEDKYVDAINPVIEQMK